MARPLPMALRERVAAFVDEGHGNREASRHFRVSPKFVNDLMKLRRETGSLSPRRQGNRVGGGKLADHADFVRRRMAERGETTLDKLCVDLQARGVTVHRSSVGRLLHRLGFSHKKTLRASEHQRPDIRHDRQLWMGRRKPFFDRALTRLVFIDETSTNTRLTKRTGWALRSERYTTSAPFGGWKTQTFIAGLRCHSMIAPWIVDAPMNKARFELYVETQLAPELRV